MRICQACGHSNEELAIICANPECRALLRRGSAPPAPPAPNGPRTAPASPEPASSPAPREPLRVTGGPSTWTQPAAGDFPAPLSQSAASGSGAGSDPVPGPSTDPVSDPMTDPAADAMSGSGVVSPSAGSDDGGLSASDDSGTMPPEPTAAEGGSTGGANDQPQDEAPAPPVVPTRPTFAAVRPGARPRPVGPPPGAAEPGGPPGAAGAGAAGEGGDGDVGGASAEEASGPTLESLRAERARFLAIKPGSTRPAPDVMWTAQASASVPDVPRVGVTLSLSPNEVNVEPGGEAVFEVLVRNTGTIVDQFTIQVTGDAARWAFVDPPSVNLYPDSDAAVVTLRFSPPSSPFTPAGPARFEVRAVSGENSNISAAGRGVVNVAPFYALSATLVPHATEGRRYGDHRLTISNQGNTRVATALTAGDPDSRLRFNVSPSSVTAEPGSEVSSELRVRPRKPLWLGSPVLRPFEVTGAADGVAPLKADGQFQHIALIPRWVPRAAIIVVPLLIALFAYFRATTKIPPVGGFALANAQKTLVNSGLKPNAIQEEPSGQVAKGLVINAATQKDPGFLGRVPKGPVTVIRSKGVEIPKVDQEPTAAANTLAGAGFAVPATPRMVADKAPAGTVVGTDPPVQQFASAGTPVTLLVSSGIPQMAVNPPSLTMPSEPVGSASEPQTVTVANAGTGPLTIASVVPGGANASDFTVTSNTCATVQPQSSCTVLVTFTPGGAGPRTATLSITSAVASGSPPVTLTGTGLTAEVGVGAANLTFDPQKVGTSSNAQNVVVNNKGSAPMTMGETTVVGNNKQDFTLSDGCKGNTVAPGSSCSVAVVFTPQDTGVRTGRLNLSNTAGGGQGVALSGKGTAPEIVLDQAFLLMSDKESKVLTVTNRGDAPLALGTARIEQSANAFKIAANDCSSQLAPSAACKITVIRDAELAAGTNCWDGVLVVPSPDRRDDMRVVLATPEKVGKSLNALLPDLHVCTV